MRVELCKCYTAEHVWSTEYSVSGPVGWKRIASNLIFALETSRVKCCVVCGVWRARRIARCAFGLDGGGTCGWPRADCKTLGAIDGWDGRAARRFHIYANGAEMHSAIDVGVWGREVGDGGAGIGWVGRWRCIENGITRTVSSFLVSFSFGDWFHWNWIGGDIVIGGSQNWFRYCTLKRRWRNILWCRFP